MKSEDYIKCENVLISDAEIVELDNDKPFATIQRTQIENIVLRYGTSANRPFAQAITSIITIGLGFIFLIPFLRWLIEGASTTLNGRGPAMFASAAFVSIILGLWLISEVLRKKYYLYINTRDGFQKISFATRTDISKINQFIRDAEQLGYYIKKDL